MTSAASYWEEEAERLRALVTAKGHELTVIQTAREERTMRELVASRQEEAILRCQLVASKEREEAATARADYWESLVSGQAEIIRAIRKELIEAHDIAGRVVTAPQESTPSPFSRARDVGGSDRRRVGG